MKILPPTSLHTLEAFHGFTLHLSKIVLTALFCGLLMAAYCWEIIRRSNLDTPISPGLGNFASFTAGSLILVLMSRLLPKDKEDEDNPLELPHLVCTGLTALTCGLLTVVITSNAWSYVIGAPTPKIGTLGDIISLTAGFLITLLVGHLFFKEN